MTQYVYGVLTANNGVIDTANTLRGAKCHATRNGYSKVYKRNAMTGFVSASAIKVDGKWIDA